MRLVTRSDFDGLACGALLKEAGLIDDYKFIHPKDMQDGLVEITANDILANVPYVAGCGMWFDHHTSEGERLGAISYRGLSKVAPSCARVVYEFLGGPARFSDHWNPLMTAVDKVDSAELTINEIEHPTGWILLGFMMDPRTGLGRYHDYRISNYQLMLELIEMCRLKTADEILLMPDVKERVDRYFYQEKMFRGMLQANSKAYGPLVVLDLRDIGDIYTGNRFIIYTLYPHCNISLRVTYGREKQNVVFSIGHSIINRTSNVNVGSLTLRYGGGGHEKVGTCQTPTEKAEQVLAELIQAITSWR